MMNDFEIRQRLTDERVRLVQQLAVFRDELGVTDPGATLPAYESYGQHPADVASDAVEREIDRTLELDLASMISEIDSALERLAGGTYGCCITCGEAITEPRLDAVPWTRFCFHHQAVVERNDDRVLDPNVPASLLDDATEIDDEDGNDRNEFSTEELALHIESDTPRS
jgi:RNA polymerase-binding transcription factor DksA